MLMVYFEFRSNDISAEVLVLSRDASAFSIVRLSSNSVSCRVFYLLLRRLAMIWRSLELTLSLVVLQQVYPPI